MKRNHVLFAVLLVLLVMMTPIVATATEAIVEVVGDFDPEALIVGGVALAPLISVLISILKGWVGLNKKYIPLINVGLGAVAVLVVGVANGGLAWPAALVMTLGVVLGSQVFHETFGHAALELKDLFGKKEKVEE